MEQAKLSDIFTFLLAEDYTLDEMVHHFNDQQLENLYKCAMALKDALEEQYQVVETLQVKAIINDDKIRVIKNAKVIVTARQFKLQGYQLNMN